MKKAILILFAALVLAALLLGCTESKPIILPLENGIDVNMTILKDADLVGLTKTYCDMNFVEGILESTTCS